MNCDPNSSDFIWWAHGLAPYKFGEFLFDVGWKIKSIAVDIREKPIISFFYPWLWGLGDFLWDIRHPIYEANDNFAAWLCPVWRVLNPGNLRDLLGDIAGHVRTLLDDPGMWVLQRFTDVFGIHHPYSATWDLAIWQFLELYFPWVNDIKRDPVNWVRWKIREANYWLSRIIDDAQAAVWELLEQERPWVRLFRANPWEFIKSMAGARSSWIWRMLDDPLGAILDVIADVFDLPPEFRQSPTSYLMGAFIRLLDNNKDVLDRVIGYWGERFIRWLWERK